MWMAAEFVTEAKFILLSQLLIYYLTTHVHWLQYTKLTTWSAFVEYKFANTVKS